MSEPALVCEHITKSFRQGAHTLEVLKGLDLRVERGECLAIMGPSGAGKSTLLHIAGGLLRPTAGSVSIDGVRLETAGDAELAAVRSQRVGFVFQMHYLLQDFSALENVALPARVRGEAKAPALARARELLDQVGLADRAEHRPGELSGGEQQRVAIARALMNRPTLVLADEPTGDLDHATAEGIHELLLRLRREQGQTLLVVTHNPELSRLADRIVRLSDGKVVDLSDGSDRSEKI
jgi:lipoprotein-releasing system ATP-binding protein